MSSVTNLYPESTTQITTKPEPIEVQLKPETYIEWSLALKFEQFWGYGTYCHAQMRIKGPYLPL